MKQVDKQRMLHHQNRANAFFRTMMLCSEEWLQYDYVDYQDAVPLLAVHTVISLTDAVLVGCTGERSNERNHRTAIK